MRWYDLLRASPIIASFSVTAAAAAVVVDAATAIVVVADAVTVIFLCCCCALLLVSFSLFGFLRFANRHLSFLVVQLKLKMKTALEKFRYIKMPSGDAMTLLVFWFSVKKQVLDHGILCSPKRSHVLKGLQRTSRVWINQLKETTPQQNEPIQCGKCKQESKVKNSNLRILNQQKPTNRGK